MSVKFTQNEINCDEFFFSNDTLLGFPKADSGMAEFSSEKPTNITAIDKVLLEVTELMDQ